MLEQKFEILMNIDLCKSIFAPTLKEIEMEEYLSDITNDMIMCLLGAGSGVIRCEIWRSYHIASDDFTIRGFRKERKMQTGFSI